MSSNIAEVRALIDTLIQDHAPENWERRKHLAAPDTLLVPCVYTEFTGFGTSVGGQPMPRGTVGADIDLVIQVPLAQEHEMEDAADQAVMTLVQIIDDAQNIFWDTARKQRLEAGHIVWRLSLTVLTSTIEGQ